MSRSVGDEWTSLEVQLIRCAYPLYGQGWEGWTRFLPDRSTKAINMKASRLGVSKEHGKNAQDASLRGPAWLNPEGVTDDPWTDQQRRRLVDATHWMVEDTGHTVMECHREFWRLFLRRRESLDARRRAQDGA